LPVTSCSCTCTSSLHGRHHPAGIYSLLPDSDHMCSHDVTLRIPKSKPRSPRGSPREQMCSARQSFTNTLAWRTRPFQIHLPSLAFVRPWDRLTSTAGVSGPGLTRANEHVGVSCQARPESYARCCANPARSPLQLQPLLGLCPLSDAVVVSMQSTHTCVLQHSDSIPLHSHREMRLHARACPPSSPLHTATSHTLSLSYSAAHALVPFPSHTPYHSHTQGHSPAVFHSHRLGACHTHPFTHTRRAGKHAPWHTRHHTTHTRGLFHTRGLNHTRCFFYTRGFFHTRGFIHTRGHSHTFHHTHRDIHAGDSRYHKGFRGLHTPPSSACTRSQHSPPLPHKARPNPPGHDPLQGGILPPLVPGGGYPAACTGSPHVVPAHPH